MLEQYVLQSLNTLIGSINLSMLPCILLKIVEVILSALVYL